MKQPFLIVLIVLSLGMVRIAVAQPGAADSLMQLGMSRYANREYAAAAEALLAAEALNPNATVKYNLACVYALLGDRAAALTWLDAAVAAGFVQVGQIEADADLAALREEPLYADILEKARRAAHPCEYRPEARQFDFWIGEWEVRNTAGRTVGENRVELILGRCVVLENWTDGFGRMGKSLNAYDAAQDRWQQTWMDDRGNVHTYTGRFTDGAMRFQREYADAEGRTVRNRLTFFPLAPDHVRQFSERSADGGATWTTVYDLHYHRKP
jgi:tetratricopeptide (TPR) repeat protein